MSGSPSTRLRIDTSPLRTSRDFRRLFSAGVISYLGSMFTFVAVPLQAQQLTGSFVVVGLLGLVEVVPIIVFGLWGGALADHYDRRVVIITAEVGSAAVRGVLLVNALRAEPQVWPLFVVGALAATLDVAAAALARGAPAPDRRRTTSSPAPPRLMSLRSSAGSSSAPRSPASVASPSGSPSPTPSTS